MAGEADDWRDRVKAVEREYKSTRIALDRLLDAAGHDPGVLRGQVELRHVRAASGHLAGTYLIRLFAEFESGLRRFWREFRRSDPPGRTRDLLDGIAATCRIPNDPLANAHAVREYRNSLVHEREDEVAVVPVGLAGDYLRRYLAFVARKWR